MNNKGNTLNEPDNNIEDLKNEIQRLSVLLEKSNSKHKSDVDALKISEDKFREIFENNSSALAIIEEDTIISMVNSEYCKISGYSKEEVTGLSWTQQIPPDDLERLKEYNKIRYSDPQNAPDKYEFTFYHKNGEIKYALMSISVLSNKKIIASFIDITDSKKAQKALLESEEKYRLLFENATQSIGVTQDKLLKFVNPKACELFGYSYGELIDMPFKVLIYPDDSQLVTDNYNKRISGEAVPNNYQFRILRKDKTIRWVEISAVLFNWQGKLASLNFLSDITERKLAENRFTLTTKILNILNKSNPLSETISETINIIQTETGFSAIGLRLKKDEDYPYYSYCGFEEDFIKKENSILEYSKDRSISRDQNGKPFYECTCGLVINGKIDTSNPLFTETGSFWTNNSPGLLKLTEAEDPRYKPRNRCIHDGFLSIALIPIRANGEIVGLLQLNDKKKDCFTIDVIHFFESISEIIGVALMRKQAEEALEQSHKLLHKLAEQVPGVIYQYQLYPDGRSCFPYSSSGMNEIYEYTPEDVLEDATPVFGRLHPEDIDKVSELIFESARTLNHYYCEFRVILPRQGLRWRYSDAIPEKLNDGSTLWHGIIYDITDRKKAELELKNKVNELEVFNNLMVDREIKMVELKKEINELLKKEGKDEKYEIFE
jgi:PAS domain S-box-containing protein